MCLISARDSPIDLAICGYAGTTMSQGGGKRDRQLSPVSQGGRHLPLEEMTETRHISEYYARHYLMVLSSYLDLCDAGDAGNVGPCLGRARVLGCTASHLTYLPFLPLQRLRLL